MTIDDVKKQISNSSARAVVEAAIVRAKADTAHALLEVIEERALQRADEIDAKLQAGEIVGPLAGVPFIAKDNMLTFGSKTTAASEILGNFEAPFQAECIERIEAAGAICIGKANLDAFAHGASTENSAYGPTTNPHDDTRVAGGSSGGSAASVALDIVPFALGSDTGGSIRQPASYCGVVGFKPSYGAVSRYGVVAMASSTDVIGPLTQTAEDALTVMQAISGKDIKDSTTTGITYDAVQTTGKKVGVIKEWLGEGVDPLVQELVQAQIEKLKSAGYEVEEVSLPSLEYSLAVYYIIVPAEVASNLARYDGIRYGVRPEGLTTLGDVYEKTRSAGYMPENKRRIMIGNYVLSSGYYDAYFQKAAKVRTLIVRDFARAFETFDFLIGPVAPSPAFKLGENTADPLAMYLADQMTVSASLAGVPAVSVPTHNSGLPIGLQIIGPQTADSQVLAFARKVEELNA
jgi:aspartyl-tRNA(Asn)/glutamyl-tRNA(Gln) amidotransferase subunit A